MNKQTIALSVSDNGSYVTIPLSGGPSRFHAVWLQDNAQNDSSVAKSSDQKLLTLHQQPTNPVIRSAMLNKDRLVVNMEGATASEYEFPVDWLEKHHYDRPSVMSSGWIDSSCQLWGKELQSNFPTANYRMISSSDPALMHWLRLIHRYGFAHLGNVGTVPGELLKVASLFGYTRETNYGRLFDVKTQVNASNLAFTTLGLQAHTDNPYRHPVPTMQILSCLENSAHGGESIVVDGFQAASLLLQENVRHFEILGRYCVRFRYNGETGVRLSSKKPILELAPDGELLAIRFNNRSIAPLCDIPFNDMPNFYAAYRHLNDIIERPALRLTFRLEPGELFIVNNTRVLHARTGFSSEGVRHLQGCYPDIDGMLSTLAALEEQDETWVAPL